MQNAALEAHFVRRVAPVVFAGARPSPEPLVVFVGGQPGAGKTRAGRATRARLGESVTPVVGDELRPFHLDYTALLASDPLGMPERTAAASAFWVERCIEHAQRSRFSVLVEGTFRRPAVTLETARGFRAAGYRTHLVVLAVPAWQSRLGILDRYVSDHAVVGAARWTTAAAHDAGFAGTPATVAAMIDAGLADRVSVLDRRARVLSDQAGALGRERALAALAAGRDRAATAAEATDFRRRLSAHVSYLEARGLADERATPLLTLLRGDARLLATHSG